MTCDRSAVVGLILCWCIALIPQSTTRGAASDLVRLEPIPSFAKLSVIQPSAVVVERDDPERYKTLQADHDPTYRTEEKKQKAEQLLRDRFSAKLSLWEQSNLSVRILYPYQPIQVDILSGEPDPLGISYMEYTLKGVVSKRTVYGPPTEPGKYLSEREEVYWYWDVPLSLRNVLAREAKNTQIDKTHEVMAIWFCPKEWSLENRENPTLCYFAEKGLAWRKQIPLKKALAVLPEPERFEYKVSPDRETILVSDNGKFVWVIATAIGHDKASDLRTYNTFIFIYNDKGELTKTVHLPNTVRRDSGDAMVLNGEAFVLTLITGQENTYTTHNVVLRADGTPLFRFANQNGKGVGNLNISRDGLRAASYATDETDKKYYACFYRLDGLAKTVAR